MRRLLATALLATLLAVGAVAGVAPAAGAQADEPVTTTSAPPQGGEIIPEPDSGTPPEDAGDRGGALQTLLFVGIVAGIAAMGYVVVRQSRQARADRGF